MFVEIKDPHIWCGYKKVAIIEFVRVEDHSRIYGDRKYRLTLSDGSNHYTVLRQEEWEKLENNAVKAILLNN